MYNVQRVAASETLEATSPVYQTQMYKPWPWNSRC